MPDYTIQGVFTPTQHAKLNFVARPELENRIYDILRTPGKQLVVYGHSGSGKSSLLGKMLNELYEDHITTRCVEGMTFDQVVLDAMDQLDIYYVAEKENQTKTAREVQLDAQFAEVRLAVQRSHEVTSGSTSGRAVPPQLTPQRLAQFMGRRKVCWVLEDFHKMLAMQKKALSQAMKVFVDESVNFPQLRVIAIGAVGTAREVVEYDAEMRTRVAEVHVPLMDTEELGKILSKGEQLLNVRFSPDQRSQITRFSNELRRSATTWRSICVRLRRSSAPVQSGSRLRMPILGMR